MSSERRAGAERHGTSFKECSDPLETGRTDADCRIKMENERIPGSQTGYAFSDTPQPAGARTFRIQEGIARAFREYLHGEGFTEIHSPKIGAKGAEGGANVFKLDYFHRPAVLAQSPQFTNR